MSAFYSFVAGVVVCFPIAMIFGIEFERGRVDRRGGRRGGWW